MSDFGAVAQLQKQSNTLQTGLVAHKSCQKWLPEQTFLPHKKHALRQQAVVLTTTAPRVLKLSHSVLPMSS